MKKSLPKYLRRREDAITTLLEKQKRVYTPAHIHQLRLELKKIDALFELLNYCSKGFKMDKTFKPFKMIIDQAGKVRELQIGRAHV